MRRSASCSSSSRAAPAPRSWGSRYVTQGCLPEQPPRRGQRQGGRGGPTRPGRPHALFSGRGGRLRGARPVVSRRIFGCARRYLGRIRVSAALRSPRRRPRVSFTVAACDVLAWEQVAACRTDGDVWCQSPRPSASQATLTAERAKRGLERAWQGVWEA